MSTITPINLTNSESPASPANTPSSVSQATLATKRVWKCREEDCHEKATFSTLTSLRHHIQQNHPRSTYRCHHCPLKFTYKGDYLTHVRMVRERLTCKICGGIAKDLFQLKKHFEISHKSLYMRCFVCNRDFISDLTFNTHHQLYHLNKPHNPPCKRVKIVCGDVEISQIIVYKKRVKVNKDEAIPQPQLQLQPEQEKSLFDSIPLPGDDLGIHDLSTEIIDKLYS